MRPAKATIRYFANVAGMLTSDTSWHAMKDAAEQTTRTSPDGPGVSTNVDTEELTTVTNAVITTIATSLGYDPDIAWGYLDLTEESTLTPAEQVFNQQTEKWLIDLENEPVDRTTMNVLRWVAAHTPAHAITAAETLTARTPTLPETADTPALDTEQFMETILNPPERVPVPR